MTIAYQNAWKIQAASTTTGPVTLGVGNGTAASATAGRLLVIGLTTGHYPGTPPDQALNQVSDNVDGATGWVKIGGINNAASVGDSVSLWAKICPSGLTSITADGGANTAYVTAYIYEISGSWGSSYADFFTVGEAATLSHSVLDTTHFITGNITTATANSILFALEINSASLAGITQAANGSGSNPASGWTLGSSTYSQENDATAWWAGSMVYNIVSTTITNAECTWDMTGDVSAGEATIIVAFHEAPAVGVKVNYLRV